MKAAEIGEGLLNYNVPEGRNQVLLTNMYIPRSEDGLLSVKRITEQSYCVKKETCRIYKNYQIIAEAGVTEIYLELKPLHLRSQFN